MNPAHSTACSLQQQIVTFCICLCVLLCPDPAHAETPPDRPNPYTITVIPFYSPEKIWLLYAPFIDHLKKTTGLPWELKLYPDHDSLIDDLCSGKVGIALLGPVPMGRADEKCGSKPFLVALGKDGKPYYHSIIVTGDPTVTDLAKVRTRKFGFFKGSTAAHIVPLKMLKDAGLNGRAYQTVFFESQDRIMTALLTKEISAAGIKESLYRKFADMPLRVLKTSSALPNFAFCASPALAAETRDRFTAALSRLRPRSVKKDAETTVSWDDEIKNGFTPPTEEYLASIVKLNSVYQEMTRETR